MLRKQEWLTLNVELVEDQHQQQSCRFFQLELAGKSLLMVRNPGGQPSDHGSGGGVIEVEVPTDPTDPTPPSGGQGAGALGFLPGNPLMVQGLPVVQVVKNEAGDTKLKIAIPL